MSSAAERHTTIADTTVYPVRDDMGDPTLQTLISVMLLALLQRWLSSQGKPTFVGMSQFFYWKQFDPSECIAPGLYVLPGVSLSPRVGAWKVWETHRVPTFALEIVSQDVDKDYLASPPKYDRLGVKELVVFDPDHARSRHRIQWQVFRRVKNRGLVKVEATNDDRVRSRVLGCFLRAVGTGDEVRLRLGTGPNGDLLLPTDEEALRQAEADRARADGERARANAERDEARAAQGRAEAEVQKLRAELAQRSRSRAKR
jgi:Uma2 family endonuclease